MLVEFSSATALDLTYDVRVREHSFSSVTNLTHLFSEESFAKFNALLHVTAQLYTDFSMLKGIR